MVAQHRDQFGDDGLDVTDDGHVGVAVLADLGRVDVGVDDLGFRRERVELAGHPVVEAGTQRDQQVAALQRRHGGHRAVHAGHAEVLPVAVGKRAAGHQRGDHRDAGQLGQLPELLGGLTADDAAADIQHRLARGRDQLGGLADLPAVRFGVGLVAGQLHPRRPAERALALQHVLGDVDQHRARTAGGRDVEGLGQHPRNVVTGADQKVVLGDRHRDARDVGLLEGVGADQPPPDLTGDSDHRDRVHLRVGQRGHQVGRSGTRRCHAHAHPAGDVRVAAGGMPGALFVADQHVAQLFRVEQRVIHRQHRTARNPENDVDAEFLQRPDDRLCTGKLLQCNMFRTSRRVLWLIRRAVWLWLECR